MTTSTDPHNPPQKPTWQDAQRIADLPHVHETLQGFADDPTGDNGVCVVLAVLNAAPQPEAAAPAAVDAELIKQIAHRWAQAAYCKALRKPFEDIDGIRRELDAALAQGEKK